MAGVLHAINVSAGGVPKRPVDAVAVTARGLDGDAQAKKGIHGGRYKAVSLYDLARIRALAGDGHHVYPGALGENLTIDGLDWDTLAPGRTLLAGDHVRLRVTMHAVPCAQIAGCFRNGDVERVHHRRHPGWSRLYAEVLCGGTLRVGDPVSLEG